MSCKISGLRAEAGGSWSAAQIEPFLDAVTAVFGPDRIMFGSDWPVSAVMAEGGSGCEGPAVSADAIPAWTDAVALWTDAGELEVDAVLWRNAARFYGLV